AQLTGHNLQAAFKYNAIVISALGFLDILNPQLSLHHSPELSQGYSLEIGGLAPLDISRIALIDPGGTSRARGSTGPEPLPHISNSRSYRRLDFPWLFSRCGTCGSLRNSRDLRCGTWPARNLAPRFALRC